MIGAESFLALSSALSFLTYCTRDWWRADESNAVLVYSMHYHYANSPYGWAKDFPHPHIPPLLACFVPTFHRHFSLVDQTLDTRDRFQK